MGTNFITYRAGETGNADKVDLTDLKFCQDERGYYMAAKFKVEDKHTIKELDVPKIRLRIKPDRVYLRAETCPYTYRTDVWIDLGFGCLPLEYVDHDGLNVMYTEKVLQEKYTEMTMDEIEKKLGYKVKIVNKKKE